MVEYRLTPTARLGLVRTIGAVKERFGPDVAGEVLDRLVEAFELLAERPSVGHRRQDLTRAARVRFWRVGLTLIAYRARGSEPIDILFVEREGRDWPRLLEKE